MTKKQKLYTLRNDPNVHYNCAQSMLIPFAGEIGITEEQANALTLNFGGGMGCGAACGALVGTLAAMGGLGTVSYTHLMPMLAAPPVVPDFSKAMTLPPPRSLSSSWA